MANNKLVRILKSETTKLIAMGTASVLIPLFGWTALTFTHNLTHGASSGRQEMCDIAKGNIASEIVDLAKRSDNPVRLATFLPAYTFALATDMGNKVYRKIYCP